MSKRRNVITALFVAHTLGVVSSLDALMSTRTSQGAVAWIVSLNTMPFVSVPAYWVFGRTKFQGYIIGRREDDTRLYHELSPKIAQLEQRTASLSQTYPPLQVIERLAKMPVQSGNHAELLINGEQTFDSILAGIDAAEHLILVQFYIVRDDQLGRELQRRLIERAREGLAVYLLYDEIGSYLLPRSYIDALTEAGVQVRRFHSTQGWTNRFQVNFRNHRKIVVVDGRVGWVGGLNVGDEYLGRDERIGVWRDTHLKLEGPAVFGLQLSFIEDWHWASGEILDFNPPEVSSYDEGLPVLILPSGPADRFDTASLMVQHAIASAQHRLWISSPYFVPDEGVLSALKIAALRGVDVRVLIPQRTDNVLTYLAAYAFIGPLLEAGVNIHRYEAGFLHGKAILIDDAASAIGTVNFDNRSFRLNFEITAWVIDTGFAAQVQSMFEADFEHAREMTPDEVTDHRWWFRIASRAAYLFAPVL